MDKTMLIWIILIALGMLLFAALYLLQMKDEADKYISLKKESKEPLQIKKEKLVKKLSLEQLKTLINALKK